MGESDEGNVEIIGWLYQFYISERKDEVMAGFKKSKKAGADEIPAATQLFTPDWIVRYLVQNTVGRLWTQNHPESQLHNTWEYYIDPVGEDAGEILKIDSPEDLTVCDPACGSSLRRPCAARNPWQAGRRASGSHRRHRRRRT